MLEPGAAPIDVGRDPQAAIHLPDEERLISRRHITVQWAEGGVKVVVLSKVNGITTNKGDYAGGQEVLLAPGDSAQLGRFSLQVQRAGAAAAAQPAMPASAAAPVDDPFLAFAGAGAPAAGPTSVFDDPFFRPSVPAAAPLADTPAALDALSGRAAPDALAGFSGMERSSADPLAAFGGQQSPLHAASSIDDFLGTPGRQPVGLGAAQLLRPEHPQQHARLATDHVHDFNMPVRPLSISVAAAPGAPAAAPADDPFAVLDLLASPAPTAKPQPPAPTAAAPAAADPWEELAKVAQSLPTQDAALQGLGREDPGHVARPRDVFSSTTTWRLDDEEVTDPMVEAPAAEALPNEAALRAAFSLPGQAGAGGAAGVEQLDVLRSLCTGLGVPTPGQMTPQHWEQLGANLRQIVVALGDLMNARAELKREMRASDRTMLGAQENNPLKGGMQVEELLQYLLFMQDGVPGYMPARQALQESVTELRAHEFASVAAVRAAVEGCIKEFDPARLRPTLLKGKTSLGSLMDNARLWDLYSAHYEQKKAHMADWLEQVFNRHFMPAYTREAERLRRQSLPPIPDRRE